MKGTTEIIVTSALLTLCSKLRVTATSHLQPRATGSKLDEKSSTNGECQRIRLSMTTKAIEQTVPPRCAMQGPICGELPL